MYSKTRYFFFLTTCLATFLAAAETMQSQSLFPSGGETEAECAQTITWKIGSVDARFDMDNDSLKSIVQSVSDLWSEAAGYPVIAYDPDGEVELNLYYTDQQQYTEDKQQLSDRIERLRQKFYAQNLMYQRQENSFENEQTEFNKKQAEYNAVVEAYNQTLSRIQTTGVRSRELDDRLKKLGREIDMKEADLASMREDLREQDAELRNLSNRLNSRANSVNELVYQYKKRFSGWRTFYQGVYLDVGGKRKINIYQFDDVGRLKLILAHEFGHALGLKHVGNPKSVMYYLTDRQNTADLQLSEEDIREIQFRCVL